MSEARRASEWRSDSSSSGCCGCGAALRLVLLDSARAALRNSAKHESSLEVSAPRPEYYLRRSGFCPSPSHKRGWLLAISRERHLGAAERCRSGCATWVRVRSRAVSSGSERAFVQHQHHRQQQQQHGNFSLLSSPAATTPILALAHAHHELVRSRVVARASTLVAP